MNDDELEQRVAHAIAARRPPPARDLEARLVAAVARPRASWLVPALASLVAAAAVVVLVWRVPRREDPVAPAPVHEVAPPPAAGSAAPDATATLSIACDPPARVLLDAREVGTTPLELRVAPGVHRLDILGAQRIVKRLELAPGEHQRIALKIQ